MAQSRVMSLVEVVTGSVIAFAVSIWANYAVLPLFGLPVKFSQSMSITIIFTAISIVRSYLVRRVFALWDTGHFEGSSGLLMNKFRPRIGSRISTT
ncbi:hypothetical protein ABIE79_010004 [Bradyrhizobium diazoefficiens]